VRGRLDATEVSQRPTESQSAAGSQPAAGAEGGRWRLRNWRLRNKLIVVLLVPSLSTAVFAGLRLNSQLAEARRFAAVQTELTLATQASKVVDTLQTERAAMVFYLAGNKVDQSPRFQQTDDSVGTLRETSAGANDLTGPVRDAVDRALARLNGLSALRSSALSTRLPDTAALTSYSQVIESLTLVDRVMATSLSDQAVSSLAGSLDSLNEAKEQIAVQNAIVISAAKHRVFPPDLVNQLHAAQAQFEAERATFVNVSSPDNNQLFQDTVSGPAVDERNRLVQLALVQSAGGMSVSVVPTTIQQLGDTTDQLFMTTIDAIQAQTETAVAARLDAAQGSALRDSVLAALALLTGLGLTVLIARSVLVPLRVLRSSALEMARTTLPAAIARILRDPETVHDTVAPVPVHSNEEIGQVARAFDIVQLEAVRLATEQAALRSNVSAMFVNLSRRSQALVERQIGVIDRLEQDEQDPDQLASLFELDHLATQMRRNSENLLVLAGTGLARRITKPVPVSEVMGAAVSEVEKYARVHLAPAPDVAVLGRAVNDVIHLVAELLDNATAFSAPSTKVAVVAAESDDDGLTIEIRDRGVGMSAAELEAANQRLVAPPEIDVTASRQMGLFVVAHLSRRHNITVRLDDNTEAETGVTATVVVPAALISREEAVQSPPPPPALPLTFAPHNGVLPTEQPAGTEAPPDEPVPVEIERIDLFTPARKDPLPAYTPAAAEPPAPSRSDHEDTSTQRLPIYEEVLSQWFRATDDDPLTEMTDPVPLPPDPHAGIDTPTKVSSSVEAAAPAGADLWRSPGDDGWRAVQALLASGPYTTTAAGLPKREPRGSLLPGSASVQPPQPRANATVTAPRRSAEALRERLATYQRGVTLGRHSTTADDAGDELDSGYPDAPKELS